MKRKRSDQKKNIRLREFKPPIHPEWKIQGIERVKELQTWLVNDGLHISLISSIYKAEVAISNPKYFDCLTDVMLHGVIKKLENIKAVRSGG